jgi:hypothetical protein
MPRQAKVKLYIEFLQIFHISGIPVPTYISKHVGVLYIFK